MKLHLHQYNETPPGGWRYKDPDTGTFIKSPTWKNLLADVRKHRTANQLPIAIDLNEQIEQQLCSLIPPEYCANSNKLLSNPAHTLTLTEALTGTAVLADWAISGMPFVDQPEAERRAVICMRCHFNNPFEGCAACNSGKLRDMVTKIVSNRHTTYDSQLHVCNICGCGLAALVHFPLDILERHFSDEQKQRLPEWCWKKTL